MSLYVPRVIAMRKKKVRRIIATLEHLFPHSGMMLTFSNPWELMVAVQLSAQCTDKKVNEVTPKLFKKYPTLDAYIRAGKTTRGVRQFERDIFQTGFYRNKAKNILLAAKMIKETFDGKLPRTMAAMLTIPGVGRKTANVVLGNAYGIVEGIAVDTHVRRLARRLGLSKHIDPEEIEQDLMAVIPKKDWFRTAYLLIDYGRKHCQAKPHQHDKCPLAKYEN